MSGSSPNSRGMRFDRESDLTTSFDKTASRSLVRDPGEQTRADSTAQGARYRILQPHAQGGLGKVSIALDTELDRHVALKEIQEHHANDASSQARFVIEAEITGKLEHPGVVPVYSLGAFPDGRPFYAMRFIEGESLKAAIDRFHGRDLRRERAPPIAAAAEMETAPLAATLAATPAASNQGSQASRRLGDRQTPDFSSIEFRELLGRFVAVCNAIAFAHSRGVIHRDLKPANIMLGRFGETLVVDWGLAKFHDHKSTSPDAAQAPTDRGPFLSPSRALGAVAGTLPGQISGTPAFMSPEQASGDLAAMGPASDIYSLGATLYCIIVGRPPIIDADVNAVLKTIERGERPRARQRCPNAPPALDAICATAMAHLPSHRYQNALALARDVERWLGDEPVSVWREPLSDRCRRWARRHQTMVVTALSVLVVSAALLSAGFAIVSVAWGNERIARRDAETNEREANRQRSRAIESVDQFFTQVSEDRRMLARLPGVQPLRQSLLEKAKDYYERFLEEDAANPALQEEVAMAHHRLAMITVAIGSRERSRELFAAARDRFRSLNKPTGAPMIRAQLATTLSNLGLEQLATGQKEEALASLQEAERLCRELRDDPENDAEIERTMANVANNSALVHQSVGDLPNALAAYREARNFYAKLSSARPADAGLRFNSARVDHNIGILHLTARRLAPAREATKSAIQEFGKLVAADGADMDAARMLASSQLVLGAIEDRASDTRSSLTAFEEAQRILERLSRENPTLNQVRLDLARTRANLSLAHQKLGRPEEALASAESAHEALATLVASQPNVAEFAATLAKTDADIAALHASRKQHAQSLPWFAKSIDALEALIVREPKNPIFASYLIEARRNRAIVNTELGRLEAALADRDRVVALAPEPRHRIGRAAALARLGRYVESDRALSELGAQTALSAELNFFAAAAWALGCGAVQRDSGLDASQRRSFIERYADQSLRCLKQARAGGYFEDHAHINEFATDKDFDAIRERTEFKELVKGLVPKSP